MGAPYDIGDTIRLGTPYDIDATVRLGAPYDIYYFYGIESGEKMHWPELH
jgi:hypothetical protein